MLGDNGVIKFGSEMADLADQMERPAIEPGTYLAVVTGITEHYKEETGSYGLFWELLINRDNSQVETWNGEAKLLPMKSYTYLGKLVNGKLSGLEKAFSAAQAFLSVNIDLKSGSVNLKEQTGKIILVNIKHETRDGRLWASVARFGKYTNPDGEVAPVLPGLEKVEQTPPDSDKPAW